MLLSHKTTGYQYIKETGTKGLDIYSRIPFKGLKKRYIQAFKNSPNLITRFTSSGYASVFSASGITRFLLQFLLVPSIVFLILYAMMEPILWGAFTFVALLFITLILVFIIKRVIGKKSQKGE